MPGYDDEPLPSLGDMFAAGVMRPTPGPPSDVTGIIQPFFPSGFMPPTRVPVRKPYRADWRGQRQGEYDPHYFDMEEDTLADDAGTVIARKDKLLPRPNLVQRMPEQATPGLMYRGMSAPEFESIMQRGQIESHGSYNMGSQKGLTYYGTDPQTAESYASSFAPTQFKPTFERPAFVLGVKQQPPERIRQVPGTGSNEIGVHGPVSAEDIAEIWRGNVAAYDPGIKERGITVAPSARLHWELLNALRGLK